MNGEVIALGAESIISHIKRWGLDFVVKTRQKKPYLLSDIDENLRNTRISRECKLLVTARTLGILTPSIYAIDYQSKSIIMDYIDGEQLKVIITKEPVNRGVILCQKFGAILAKLHNGGIVHGDPTTSNILVDKEEKIWMIDFGLAEMNATIEMKGVDLHLVRRAFETTHWEYQDPLFDAVIEGYTTNLNDSAGEVLNRMNEIRERGRYH
jgi:TP53 regulating kinase-like protein